MIKKLKEKFSGLVKDKKGVSELVQMLIVLGVVVAVAAIVVPYVYRVVNNAMSGVANGSQITSAVSPTTTVK